MGEKEEIVLENLLGDKYYECKTALQIMQEQEIEDVVHETLTRLKKGNSEYGESNEYAARIVKAFRTLTKKELTVDDYYLLMILTKIVRETNKNKYDNVLDIAGYALLWLKYKK